MCLSAWFLVLLCETQAEFWAPDAGLAQSWVVVGIAELNQQMEDCFFYLPLLICLSNNNKF